MHSIGTGQFVIGDTKVRPRIDDIFKRDEKMGIYFKLYNLGSDEATRKPEGQVEWELTRNGSNEKVFNYTQNFSEVPDATPSQMTIQQFLPLKTLAPGKYTLRMKVTDKIRHQVLTPTADFTVT